MNTQPMPKKQKGAALVIVMVLLASGLMIGVSGMNASLVDERLAGNYRAVSVATMRAEQGASEAIPQNSSFSYIEEISYDSESYDLWKKYYESDELAGYEDDCFNDNKECFFYLPGKIDGEDKILAMGAVLDANSNILAVSNAIYIGFTGGGGGGFGAASIIGEIKESAITLPSSANSGLFGGEVELDGEVVDISALSFANDNGSYNKDGLIEGNKAFLSDENVDANKEVESQQYLLDLLWELYVSPSANEYYESGPGDSGKSTCSGLCFYEDGLKNTGNDTLGGLHVVLNGDAQVGGNADIQGMLVVLNINRNDDIDLNEKSAWSVGNLEKVDQVKLNGGGNKGTVHFDEAAVKSALSGSGVSLSKLLNGSGSGSGSSGQNVKWSYGVK